MHVVSAGEHSEREPKDRIVPLFPLSGVLLLPGTFLPLNVFERRYCNLVEDALAGERRIGMVQPRTPARDPLGPVAGAPENPPIYDIGCLGRISECEQQPDGRFHIVLEGERRFRIESELPGVRGYRRALAACERVGREDDRATREGRCEDLLQAALDFARRFELDFDDDLLVSLEPVRLVNVLAAALPFGAVEKQALLEAPTLDDRSQMLIALIRMTSDEEPGFDPDATPIVH